jgi:hypothetical protein
VVTTNRSSAAHLFDAARSLRGPAVWGWDLEPRNEIVAVDGDTGTVATQPVDREI